MVNHFLSSISEMYRFQVKMNNTKVRTEFKILVADFYISSLKCSDGNDIKKYFYLKKI